MTPLGPYVSPWTTTPWYLIMVTTGVYAVVPDGTQPRDASLRAPTVRELRTWLKENGFEEVRC